MIPTSTPNIDAERVSRVLAQLGDQEPIILFGVRGYYKRTMGDPEKNDRGIYDDAMVLINKGSIATWNANTDPSGYRDATKARKGMAVLEPGKYLYKVGIHGLSRPKDKQYLALVQASPVTVLRDGGKLESGWFGINIHRGGNTTTSSEGCQTIPPGRQWDQFFSTVRNLIFSGTIAYRLIEVETWEAMQSGHQ